MGTRAVTLRIAARYLEAEGISSVPLVEHSDFRRACPPLFAPAAEVPAASPAEARRKAADHSVTSYYRLTDSEGAVRLTDDFAINECYHNRQYMLLSAYRHLLGDDLGGISFLDVAGSNGYYCFHAARLGFGRVCCLDGREEHRSQFLMLRDMARCPRVDFNLMQVEDLGALRGQAFDVVSAQGILHHLYDHYTFLARLAGLCKRLLILDTHLNGRVDPTADLYSEVHDNPRDSPFCPVSLTPSLSVVVELLKAVGFRNIQRVPYPGQIVRHDDARSDRYGYGALRRIMLVASPAG